METPFTLNSDLDEEDARFRAAIPEELDGPSPGIPNEVVKAYFAKWREIALSNRSHEEFLAAIEAIEKPF
jgi:hypothetical protein